MTNESPKTITKVFFFGKNPINSHNYKIAAFIIGVWSGITGRIIFMFVPNKISSMTT